MSRQDRLALSILACTGVRLDEIALLEWGQVHEEGFNGRNVRYLDTTGAIVKNKPSRRLIPLVPEVWKLFPTKVTVTNKKEPEVYLRTPERARIEKPKIRHLMP